MKRKKINERRNGSKNNEKRLKEKGREIIK